MTKQLAQAWLETQLLALTNHLECDDDQDQHDRHHHAQQAASWFMHEDKGGFSLHACCKALCMDVESLRAAVLRMLERRRLRKVALWRRREADEKRFCQWQSWGMAI